jgi:carbon storage regulator CsrA
MLVLTRHVGEAIVIGGDVRLAVLTVQGPRVVLGLEAPAGVAVRRAELSPPPGDGPAACATPAASPLAEPVAGHGPVRPPAVPGPAAPPCPHRPGAPAAVAGSSDREAPTPDVSYRHLRVEAVAGETAVALRANRLDHLAAEAAAGELSRLARERAGTRLRLDLGGVTYLSSAGLGALLALSRRVRAAGGQLALENVEPAVYEVFEVTHLTAVLNVCRKPD